MLNTFFSIYLLITIIICIVQLKVGIAMYIFYSILVPIVQFFSFGQNLFPFIIIIIIFLKYNYKTLIYKPLYPFLFLFIAQLLLIPFQSEVPTNIQLNSFRVDLMSTLLLPFAMINVMKHDSKALTLFGNTIAVSIIIAVFYSLFLMTMPGLNPYILLVNPFENNQLMDTYYYSDYYAAEGQGRLFGRISGVFIHPMTNGFFLSMALIYILSKAFNIKIGRKKKCVLYISFFIVSFTIFFIGVRSAIGAIILGLIIFILLERKFNLILFALIGVGVFYIVFQQIPGMDDFITSMFDSKSDKVSGSSFEMRISQFNGALNEIKSNPSIGKGYAWTRYYTSTQGTHPTLLAFESLIYVVLCNNGFVGIAIWSIMIILYCRGVFKYFEPYYSHVILALFVTYISYSIITGEYGYMKYLLIFYSIMWMYGLKYYNKKQQITNIYGEKSKTNRLLFTTISSNSRK